MSITLPFAKCWIAHSVAPVFDDAIPTKSFLKFSKKRTLTCITIQEIFFKEIRKNDLELWIGLNIC